MPNTNMYNLGEVRPTPLGSMSELGRSSLESIRTVPPKIPVIGGIFGARRGTNLPGENRGNSTTFNLLDIFKGITRLPFRLASGITGIGRATNRGYPAMWGNPEHNRRITGNYY